MSSARPINSLDSILHGHAGSETLNVGRAVRRACFGMSIALLALLTSACTGGPTGSRGTSVPTRGPGSAGSTTPSLSPTTTLGGGGLTGIGATLAMFTSAHSADSGLPHVCSASDSCFGSELTNAEYGATYQFINALIVERRITGYQQNFRPDTDLASVQADVLQLFPSDARAGALTVVDNSGSCAMFDVTSPTLGTLFSGPAFGDPQGVIGVELTYIDQAGDLAYDASNIQEANLSMQPVDPTSTC